MNPRVLRVALTALALVTVTARAAEFHISPGGNDANPGTKDKPFATPARAVAAVRTLVAGGLNRDVRVVLHGGTYALEAPLVFTPADSGSADHAITYAAAPGETVVISGGRPITSWKPSGGAKWTVELPGVEAGHHIHPPAGQCGQGGVFAPGPVGQQDVAPLEVLPQPPEQAQVIVAQTPQGHVQDRPAGEGKEHHELQQGKAAAGFLGRALGIALLVLGRVGQLGAGAVGDLDGALPQAGAAPGAAVGRLGGHAQGLFETFAWQALAGLDIGRVAFVHRRAPLQAQEGLDVTDDFAAGGVGFEHLPEEALAGQAQVEDAVAAVGAFVGRGEHGRRQELPQVLLELSQGGLPKRGGRAAAQRGQAGTEGWEEGGLRHRAVVLPPY